MVDSTARKAAESEVKKAEKAFEAASKKASNEREKYAALQAEANRAARALAHAKTNPDLFDDDPLAVVMPTFPSQGIAEVAARSQGIAAIEAAPHEDAVVTLPYTTEVTPITPADLMPSVQLTEYIAATDEVIAEIATQDPWDAPQRTEPPEQVEAPKTRRPRRTKAQMEAARAAALAGKTPDEDGAIDADASVAPQAAVATPAANPFQPF